ncbi:MAG: ZIP family metal transporter [Patescibacteria group bacterium]
MVYFIALATVISTLLGGVFALRFKDKLHLILGFSAGAVIGVAFFDLLPEALELAGTAYTIPFITSIVALGFVVFMILDRLVFFHAHEDEHCDELMKRGVLGAGSLSIHSFLDGVAIGLAFKVSLAVGLVVAIGVLAHDFSDGINTVGLILKNNGSRRDAFKWLFADALAPALGVLSTIFFSVADASLGLLLALFCGFFLYIGASDLLPESHHRHPTVWTTLLSILGVATLYGVIRLAGI